MKNDASKDSNNVSSLLGVSSSDQKSTVPIYADPTLHALLITGSLISTSSNLTTEIDYNGGTNATYVGTATPGSAVSAAAWTIKFLTYDGNNNVLSVTFANAGTATNIWNNRAGYTYS